MGRAMERIPSPRRSRNISDGSRPTHAMSASPLVGHVWDVGYQDWSSCQEWGLLSPCSEAIPYLL
jgi:hypothetical protein